MARAEGEDGADVLGVEKIDYLVWLLASTHKSVEQLVEPLERLCLIADGAGRAETGFRIGGGKPPLFACACWIVCGVTGENVKCTALIL